MDDEVFVTVDYRDEDFVRVRRLALITRLRETNTGQLVLFVLLAAIGALFLAPDPIGRIFASAGGALVGLVAVLVILGFLRAAKPMKLPIASASIEISSAGVVVKSSRGWVRFAWRDFEGVHEGMGVFVWSGKITVVVPRRCLRKDQLETLRALVRVHGVDSGSRSGALPAPAEQNDGNRS